MTQWPFLAPIAPRRHARLVNWLQDIYPETAAVLGVPLVRGPIAAALSALRNRTLRQAQATIVAGELMARRANRDFICHSYRKSVAPSSRCPSP